MLVEFEDDDLRRLHEELDFRVPALGPELVRAYRKRMQMIAAAKDRRDLYAMKSNRLEKLKGDRQDQHSLRISDQWRLIVRFEKGAEGEKVVVMEIADYH